MREVVTVSLPKAYRVRLDRLTKKSRSSRSDLVRKALDQLFLKQDFLAVSKKLATQAKKQGIFSDEDVFRLTS